MKTPAKILSYFGSVALGGVLALSFFHLTIMADHTSRTKDSLAKLSKEVSVHRAAGARSLLDQCQINGFAYLPNTSDNGEKAYIECDSITINKVIKPEVASLSIAVNSQIQRHNYVDLIK